MTIRKIIAAILLCATLMTFSQASVAAEKMYRLNVSGCWG